jgi:hypothetical protein
MQKTFFKSLPLHLHPSWSFSLSRPFANSRDIRYPEILQMHVQVLLQHITSVPVIQNLPSLVRRIVDSQLPHGGDIIIDLYQQFLLQYHFRALALAEMESAPSQPDGELGYGRMATPLTTQSSGSPPPPSPRYEVPSSCPQKSPSKKTAKQPAKQPAKKPAKKPVKQPLKQPAKQPAKKPAKQPSKK